MKRNPVFWCLILASPFWIAHAQWQRVQSPFGEYISDLTVCGGTAYAASTESGVYASSDHGASWSLQNSGLTESAVRALAATDVHVFAGTATGIYVMFEGTTQWQRVLSTPTIACIHAAKPVILAGSDAGGMYRSSDDGQSWSTVGFSVQNARVYSIASNNLTCFAAIEYDSAAFKNLAGVFRSTDQGRTWRRCNAGAMAQKERITQVAVTGGVLLASGPQHGIFRSLDDGTTWQTANTGIPGTAIVQSMRACWPDVLLGTTEGIMRSTDSGNLWTPYAFDHPNPVATCFATSGSYLLAGSLGGGVQRLQMNDVHWRPGTGMHLVRGRSLAAYQDSRLVLGSEAGSVYRLAAGTTTWSVIDQKLPREPITALLTENDTIFAGSASGVSVKTSETASWATPCNSTCPLRVEKLQKLDKPGIVYFPFFWNQSRRSNLMAITRDPGGIGHAFFTSPLDMVNGWSEFSCGFFNQSSTPISVVRCGAPWYVATHGGVYSTITAGQSWTDCNATLPDRRVNELLSHEGVLHAATSAGLFSSTNGGVTWTDPSFGFPQASNYYRMIIRNGILIAATRLDPGYWMVWCRNLRTRQTLELSVNIPRESIQAMDISGNILYAVFASGEVWNYVLPFPDSPDLAPAAPLPMYAIWDKTRQLGVTVRESNLGLAPAPAHAIALWLDSNDVFTPSSAVRLTPEITVEQPHPTPDITDEYRLMLDPMPDFPGGAYYLYVQSDPQGAVAEGDETNNISRSTDRIRIDFARPDMYFTSFDVDARTWTVGERHRLAWEVRNSGTLDFSGSTIVRILLARIDPLSGVRTIVSELAQTTVTNLDMPCSPPVICISSIADSREIEVDASWSGEYVLLACIDTTAALPELSKANNVELITGITVHALPPDVTVNGAYSGPSGAWSPCGDSVTVTLTVDNIGWSPSSPCTATIFITSDTAGIPHAGCITLREKVPIPDLDPGNRITLPPQTMAVPPLAPGAYFLFIQADPDAVNADSDPRNNVRILLPPVSIAPATRDLAATGIQVIGQPPTLPGGELKVLLDVGNRERCATPACTAALSLHPVPTGAPIVIPDAVPIPILPAMGGTQLTVTRSIPASVPDGRYELRCTVDAGNTVAESDEANNVILWNGVLTIMTQSDLVLASVRILPMMSTPDSTRWASDSVRVLRIVERSVGRPIDEAHVVTAAVSPSCTLAGSTVLFTDTIEAAQWRTDSVVIIREAVMPRIPGTFRVMVVLNASHELPELRFDNNELCLGPVIVTGIDPTARPAEYAVFTVFPNPSSGNVTITIERPEVTHSSVDILDHLGRAVARLAPDASGSCLWNGRDAHGTPVPPGVYLLRVLHDGSPAAFRPIIRL